jgi:hypothetical protein
MLHFFCFLLSAFSLSLQSRHVHVIQTPPALMAKKGDVHEHGHVKPVEKATEKARHVHVISTPHALVTEKAEVHEPGHLKPLEKAIKKAEKDKDLTKRHIRGPHSHDGPEPEEKEHVLTGSDRYTTPVPTCALFVQISASKDAGDPFCHKGLASSDLSACCQADCDECSDTSDICSDEESGRQSTCCPAAIKEAGEKCDDSHAPCMMAPQTSEGLTSAEGVRNAAFDCKNSVKDEMDRQRVSTDYLKHVGKALLPSPEELDCNAESWKTIEDIAYACEQREGCGGFSTDMDGVPKCLLAESDELAKLVDDTGKNTYIRVVNKKGLSFRLEAGPWSECSVTCGNGTQTRELFCNSEMGTDSSLERCQGIYSVAGLPATEMGCNEFGCPCEAGQAIVDNDVNLTNEFEMTFDATGKFYCNQFDDLATGEVDWHCADYTSGDLTKTGGECFNGCEAGSSIEDNGATVALATNLMHGNSADILCPLESHTGEVKLTCNDATLEKASGGCTKICTATSIGEAMQAIESMTYPEVSNKLVDGEETILTCPEGAIGEFRISCTDGVVNAAGNCTSHCQQPEQPSDIACPEMMGTFYYYYGTQYGMMRDGDQLRITHCYSGQAYYRATVYDNCVVDFGWGTGSYVEDQCTMYWDFYQNSFRYFGKDCNEEKGITYVEAKQQSRDYCAFEIDDSVNCSGLQGKFWYYQGTELGLQRVGNEVMFIGCENGYSWYRGSVDDQCVFDFYYFYMQATYNEEQCTMFWDGYGDHYRHFNQACNEERGYDFNAAYNAEPDFCPQSEADTTSDICPEMAGIFYYYHGTKYVIKRDGDFATFENCDSGYNYFKLKVQEDCSMHWYYFGSYYRTTFDADNCVWHWPQYPDSYRYFDKTCMEEKGLGTWESVTGMESWYDYYVAYYEDHH